MADRRHQATQNLPDDMSNVMIADGIGEMSGQENPALRKFSLEWHTVKVQKKLRTVPVYNDDGTRAKNPKGSPKVVTEYEKNFPFQVPVGHAYAPGTDKVNTLIESLCDQIGNAEQLGHFVRQVVKEGKDGYATETSIIEHMLWGLLQHPLQQLRQGQEARLTEAQRNALNAIMQSYKLGMLIGMRHPITDDILINNEEEAFEFCVKQAERQGIPDARKELQTRLFGIDDEENSDE